MTDEPMIKFLASVTLLLREQDVHLLLKAVIAYTPRTEEEKRTQAYLIDLLEVLAGEEDTT